LPLALALFLLLGLSWPVGALANDGCLVAAAADEGCAAAAAGGIEAGAVGVGSVGKSGKAGRSPKGGRAKAAGVMPKSSNDGRGASGAKLSLMAAGMGAGYSRWDERRAEREREVEP